MRQVAADYTTSIDEPAGQVTKLTAAIEKVLHASHKNKLEPLAMAIPTRLPYFELTPREKEVLLLLAEGLTSKTIARRLGISFKTAVCHRSRIMSKLNVHETVSLVRYAIREKLIEP